jgi:hypothetical protein
MRKIPTLFVRDPENRANVLDEVTPGCEWVLEGEGKATRKYDGTCMMLDTDGKWWARREVKPGKIEPLNYVVDNVDEVTGKTQGWEPVEQSPFAKFHVEALLVVHNRVAGTYELVGPKVQGNPEKLEGHRLYSHAEAESLWVFPIPNPHNPALRPWVCSNQPGAIKLAVSSLSWEGIVWHHPDGRMAKLKTKDVN